jgi:hypothetical protein
MCHAGIAVSEEIARLVRAKLNTCITILRRQTLPVGELMRLRREQRPASFGGAGATGAVRAS